MTRARIAIALAILAAAAPSLAQTPSQTAPQTPPAASPFEGVWQVIPRGPPGGPPGGPRGGPRGGRPGGPGRGPDAEGRISLGAPRPLEPPPGALQGGPNLPQNLADVLDGGDRHTYAIMTPEGQARFAAFDPKALPANNCKSPGLPSIAMTPNLQEWSVTPAKVSIRHEYFDTRREIALSAASKPSGRPTDLGHATGKIEGDRISFETTGVRGDWSGLGRNAPSSDARVVRETYQLVDHDTLSGQIEIEDARYLTAPLRMRVMLRRAPAGTHIETFPCDLEASRRDVAG